MYGRFAVRDYLLALGAKDERDIIPPDFAKAHRILIQAVTGERGPLGDWQRQVDSDPAVTIHYILANEKFNVATLFTTGMSDKNLPKGRYRFTQHELRLMLPADWPVGGDDPQTNWPVAWLERITRKLLAGDRWPDEPILFMHDGPLAEGTELCGWIGLPSFAEVTELQDSRIANITAFFPIYAEEAEFAREQGNNALLERFQEHDVPLHVDPQRRNVAW